MKITQKDIEEFQRELRYSEKSAATVSKYGACLGAFAAWLRGREVSKELLLEYRDHLLQTLLPQTVNGHLSAIHGFLGFHGLEKLQVRFLKVQRKAFLEERRELSEGEYKRLLAAAQGRGNERLGLVMMTICATGIRVSELVFITAQAAKTGRAEIRMKGKCRTILLPRELCRRLQRYAKSAQISTGPLFRTRSGRPLDRSNICHEMKKLCKLSGVERCKIFPHNLRHLFARSFIAIENNIAHLADVLGHSRIETTRVYTAVSATAHRKILNQMRLVL